MQSRLPRGLRGSLRSSAQSLDPSRLLARTFTRRGNPGLFSKKHPEPEQQHHSAELDEFEVVDRDDIPTQADDEPLAPPSLPPPPTNSEFSTGETCKPSRTKSKSALYRLKNLSKASLHLSTFPSSRQTVQSNRAAEISDIYLAFPQPPTHIPTPITSTYGSLASSTLVTANQEFDETCSTLRVSPHFPGDFVLGSAQPHSESPSEFDAYPEPSSTPVQRSEHITSPPVFDFTVRGSHKFTGSLRRFRSLSRRLRGSFTSRVSDVSSGETVRSRKRRSSRATSSSVSARSLFLYSSSSNLLAEPAVDNPSTPSEAALIALARKAVVASESSSPAPLPVPAPASDALHPEQVKEQVPPVLKHEFVDPLELTASPSPFSASSLLSPSSRTSFIPPSPSWLSRNVQNFDQFDYRSIFPPSRISSLTDSEHLRIPEISTYITSALFAADSPKPLHVPPPFLPIPAPRTRYPPDSPYKPVLQRVVTDIYLATPEEDPDSLATPISLAESSVSSSSASITSSGAFVSAQPSPILYNRLSAASRISEERQRQSIAARKTRLNSPRARRHSFKENRRSLNPLFKAGSLLSYHTTSDHPNSQELSYSPRTPFSPSSTTLNLSVPTSLAPLSSTQTP